MPTRTIRSGVGAAVLSLAATACAGAVPAGDQAVTTLRVWRHSGTQGEQDAFAKQVSALHRVQGAVRVKVRTIPEGDYNDVVQAAVAAGSLPDVLDVDGPLIASYVHQSVLAPLDGLVPRRVLEGQLPSLRAQATVEGRTWALGAFDSGLGIFGSRSLLREAGVTPPRDAATAWTADEFDAALKALSRRDPDGKVLDLKLNYGTGEWLTYGFVPLLASAGGGLVDPGSGRAQGALNGEGSVRALARLADWARVADANEDDRAFVDGRVALSWVGHWAYPGYAEALRDDLVLLPLPDMGRGAKTGQGSWAWTVTAPPARRDAAADLLTFLMTDREVLRTAAANGAVPGTSSALAESAHYGAGGPLRLFADQLVGTCGDREPDRSCFGVPRPITPAYPVITAQVSRAIADVLDGADPQGVLDEAARAIDRDRARNSGY